MPYDQASLLARLPGAYSSDPAGNNGKLMNAFVAGYWAQITQNVTDLQNARFVSTASGNVLDKIAVFMGIARQPGESDANYRLRLKGMTPQMHSRNTIDDIVQVVTAMIGATPADVTLVENTDPTDGSYRPAFFQVRFALDLLSRQGFTPDQYDGVIMNMNMLLVALAPAGVNASVFVTTGAKFDTAVFDGAASQFGS